MKILAIETSCDETSAAVTNNDNILSNVISSQIELHKKWGGVVPDIARRAHQERIQPVINEALQRAKVDLDQIDYIAVTYGPGLAIALEVGLNKAKELARIYKKDLIPVNHMEAHLLSSFAKNSKGKNPYGASYNKSLFPALGLLISGGHTEIVLIKDIGQYEILGETLDDAAGEAFDKVSKMLGLGYPGGPIISEFAKKGKPGTFELPIPMQYSKDLNFSYSGLKTACLYKIKNFESENPNLPQKEWVYNFCADFVNSVIKSIVLKMEKATELYDIKSVFLGGGVNSNTMLRSRIRTTMKNKGINVYQPYSPKLYTDNAGMIALAAYYATKRKDTIFSEETFDKIDRNPVATIDEKLNLS